MNILRWAGRGLLLLIASGAITAWVFIVTLNMTLLNRTTVFGWLDASGAYSHVAQSVVGLQTPESGGDVIGADAFKQAITNTLSPPVIKGVVENILGATYDWIEGKTQKIDFSISLADKRDELQNQLATAIEPQLRGLPACGTSFSGLSVSQEDIQCLPRGSNAQATAESMAKQTIDSSDFLAKPITAETLGGIDTSSFWWLPLLAQNLAWLSIALPLIAAAGIAGYVFLNSDRLLGLRSIAGHIFFSTTFMTVIGALLWYFGGIVSFSDALGNAGEVAMLKDVIEPIIHQAAPAIGGWLTLLAGSVWLVAGATWITLLVLHHRKKPTVTVEQPTMQSVPRNPEEHVVQPQAPNPKPEEPKAPPKTIGRT